MYNKFVVQDHFLSYFFVCKLIIHQKVLYDIFYGKVVKWCKDCKNGKILKDNIDKLKAIGIDITMGKFEKRYNVNMQLARQAVSEGIIISSQNQFYQNVNIYSWYITHKKQFSEKDKKVLDELLYDGKNKSVKILDAKTDQVIDIYPSIKEAGKALYEKYHVANSSETGSLVIHNRLTGKTKKAVYKERFKFEYVKSINRKM